MISVLMILVMFSLLLPNRVAGAEETTGIERLGGKDRYEVSANVSKKIDFLNIDSGTVVIARGDLYPDALSGGPLASTEHSPILLTATSSLPMSVQAEIKRRSPDKAIILGGTGSVSVNVEEQLKSSGITTIERISGSNRFAVSAAVAEKVAEAKTPDTAIVVSGLGFPDALSASSIASQKGMPILLVETDKIPVSIESFIQNHRQIKNFIIVGGTATVSDNVKSELEQYGKVHRIAGANRYLVAINVAKYFKMNLSSLVFARGDVFADALSGGPLAAYTGSPILLTTSGKIETNVESFLKANLGKTQTMYILGGLGSISADAEKQLSNYISDPPEVRAFWVDMFHDGAKTPEQVDKLLQDVKNANANAIFLQIRRRGDAFYNKSIEPRTEDPGLPAGYDPLADLIQKAHASNPRIQVHAWFATMPVWNKSTPPKDPNHVFNLHGPGKTGRDFWLSKNYSGSYMSGSEYVVDPGHPDVVNYTTNVVTHVVKNYNIDGVHLDLIRYMGSDWGYNPTSVERFNRIYNRTGNPSPTDEQWKAWRREQVNNFVGKIYVNTMAIKPNVIVSAAAIAWGDGPKTMEDYMASRTMNDALQDWNRWLENGWVDLAIPMNYFREFDSAQKQYYMNWLAWEKEHQHERMTASGIGVYLNSISDGLIQIRKTREPSQTGKRLAGVNLYSYAVTNKDGAANSEFYSALSAPSAYDSQTPVFNRVALPPEMAWKTNPTSGHLMGSVIHSDGTTSDHETVTITGPESQTVQTDGSGDFQLINLSPGIYTVSVGQVSQTVTISAGQVTQITLN